MQRIMEQFRAMEEREKKKTERKNTTPHSSVSARKNSNPKKIVAVVDRKKSSKSPRASPRKRKLNDELNEAKDVKQPKEKRVKLDKKKIEVKKKRMENEKHVSVKRKRPPPRERPSPRVEKKEGKATSSKKMKIMQSDDTKNLPKKRYILLVDRQEGTPPVFPFKKRWKHQRSFGLHDKVKNLLRTADAVLGNISRKEIRKNEVKGEPKLLVTGPITTSPAIAAFRESLNPPEFKLN